MSLASYNKERVPVYASIFLLVTLGVFILQLSDGDNGLVHNLWTSSLFGLISFVISLLLSTFYYLFVPGWKRIHFPSFSPQNISFVVLNLGLISIGNYLLVVFMSGDHFSLETYTFILIATLIIAILPIMVVSLLERNARLRKEIDLKTPIEEKLGKKKEGYSLTIEDGRFGSVNLETFCFGESNRNYVKLISTDGSEKEIRITLKEFEAALSAYDFILRCHRSFLVNMMNVQQITGNKKGYEIRFKSEQEMPPIQVSRSYVPAVKKWVDDHGLSILG